MTLIERVSLIYEDEKKEKPPVQVRSFEISGVPWPKIKGLPAKVSVTGCPVVYLTCNHQDGDVFLGFPISFWPYVKLRWHRLWRSS